MLITFDLDGVLIKNPFKDGVFPEVIKILGEQFINQQGLFENELEEKIWGEITAEFIKRLNSKIPHLAYDWDGVIQQAAVNMGCSGGIDVEGLVKKYCKYPYIRQLNSSRELLKRLSEDSCRLVIITNGYYKYQYPVLKALEMDQYFEEIISPEKTKSIKPEKDIFLEASPCQEVWYHVGDTLSHDICGANQAGAISVWLVDCLPEKLKKISPDKRSSSEEGIKLCRDQLREEIRRNIVSRGFSPVDIKPGYIIESLDELRQFIKT